MCANNLPKVVTWKRKAGGRTRDLSSRKANVLTITPPGHIATSDNQLKRRGRRCDTLCTSGFMDDVTFANSGTYGGTSIPLQLRVTTLRLRAQANTPAAS